MNPDYFTLDDFFELSEEMEVYKDGCEEELLFEALRDLSKSSPEAKKSKGSLDKNRIAILGNNIKDIIHLITYFLDSTVTSEIIEILQRKLIYLGYEESVGISIPDTLTSDSLGESIINYFISIDFKKEDMSKEIKVKMLRTLNNEYGKLYL